MLNIAIDGPAGAGKSSVARKVAEIFNIFYFDTGALYRAVGFYMLKKGLFNRQGFSIEGELAFCNLELKYLNKKQHIFLCGEDLNSHIRTSNVAAAASFVSRNLKVREYLLNMQRDFAKVHSVVMDGRDIGTVVLPSANLKVFLTASLRARAFRRYKELILNGGNYNFEDVFNNIKARDLSDSAREIAPLRAAKDAVVIDTTYFSLDESVKKVQSLVEQLNLEEYIELL